jgi:hypothetical protein
MISCIASLYREGCSSPALALILHLGATEAHPLYGASVARLGIPIFGSNFWDPHQKWNSDSVFDSEDSGRKIFFEFRC